MYDRGKTGASKEKGALQFQIAEFRKALQYYDTLVKKKKKRERERPHCVDIGGKVFFTDRTSSKQTS